MSDQSSIPAEVWDLIQMARVSVTQVIGVEPDLTPETLPLVDQYLYQLDPKAKPEVKDLMIAAIGCHFGEVTRRILHGRWSLPRPDPKSWRIELVECFLHFSPVGMAGEVFVSTQSDDHDGSFGTLDELSDPLEEMLSEAAPISEKEYYSLSGRIDILQLVADWLVAHVIASKRGRQRFSASDYSLLLDQID